jgi:hypothetical protein
MSLFPKLHSAFRLNPIYVARIPAGPFAAANMQTMATALAIANF